MTTAPPPAMRPTEPSATEPSATEPSVHRPPERPPQRPAAGGRTPWWVWLIIVAIVGGLTWAVVHSVRAAKAEAAGGGGGHHGGHGGGGHESALPVVVATVRRGDLPVYLYGLGTVTPLKTVTVRTRVDGAITKINYTEGQHVKVGDFLLQIDPAPYQAVLDQAKGQLVRDKATYDSAAWNVTQDLIALKDKAIAEQQLHTDTAARDSADGAMAIDKANIEAAQVNVNYCHVTSPIDGVIGLRDVDEGNIVHAADTTALTTIAQLRPITVLFTLPEDDLAQLRQRMDKEAKVPVDAYDRTFQHRLGRGTLGALDSAIDPATLTIRAKAQFDNDNDSLYPDQAVNARLLVDTIKGAILVPSAAIQNSPTETFVYVVGSGDAVKMRAVTPGPALSAVGPDEADTTIVTSGLEPGEVVVTDGVDKLTDGTKVLPKPAEDRHHGGGPSSRPATGPSGATTMPVDETNVGGPAMTHKGGGGHGRRPHGGPPAAAPN